MVVASRPAFNGRGWQLHGSTSPSGEGSIAVTKVLLVDDEESFARLVKLALEDAGGFEVRTENDPRRAAQVASGFGPDVMVLDLLMPDLGGFELAERLRADVRVGRCPIIFLSAAVSRECPCMESDQLQDCRILAKPIGADELARTIEDVLQKGP
jgi:two-component system OmpR family response regulator